MITFLDIILFSTIGISTFLGFFKGLIEVFIGTFILIISILSVEYLDPYVSSMLKEYIVDDFIVKLLSYFISFIFGYLSSTLIFNPIIQVFFYFSKSMINKVLGIPAGFIRGVIISLGIFGLLIMPLSFKFEKDLEENLPTWIKTSIYYSYVRKFNGLDYITNFISKYSEKKLDVFKKI